MNSKRIAVLASALAVGAAVLPAASAAAASNTVSCRPANTSGAGYLYAEWDKNGTSVNLRHVEETNKTSRTASLISRYFAVTDTAGTTVVVFRRGDVSSLAVGAMTAYDVNPGYYPLYSKPRVTSTYRVYDGNSYNTCTDTLYLS